MPKAGIIFSDVDGTLTQNRATSMLDLRAVNAARELIKQGFKVVLVSGNSLPVLRGISIYLGLGGYVVAENGAVIFTDKMIKVCRGCERVKEVRRFILSAGKGLFTDSWQNTFRICDMALRWVGDEEKALSIARDLIAEGGFNDVEVVTSGYAIHIHPRECGKAAGIKRFISELRFKGEVICVGDGRNDVPMREACDELYAVSNADEELKAIADQTLSKPSSAGFIELAEELLRGTLKNQ